jgi:hypothetical protein
MTAQSNAPIIIKRKKVIAAGHHGGAWKVAYADFVTAMMAFFLLMWLLGATNEKQRVVFGGRDFFAGGILVLGICEISVNRTKVLQSDHCACVCKNTSHLAVSCSGRVSASFRKRHSDA